MPPTHTHTPGLTRGAAGRRWWTGPGVLCTPCSRIWTPGSRAWDAGGSGRAGPSARVPSASPAGPVAQKTLGTAGPPPPPPAFSARARNKGGARSQQTMETFAFLSPPPIRAPGPGSSGGSRRPRGLRRGAPTTPARDRPLRMRGPGAGGRGRPRSLAQARSPWQRARGGRGRAAAAAISAASCSSRPRRHGNGVTHRGRFPARLARVTPAARAPSSLTCRFPSPPASSAPGTGPVRRARCPASFPSSAVHGPGGRQIDGGRLLKNIVTVSVLAALTRERYLRLLSAARAGGSAGSRGSPGVPGSAGWGAPGARGGTAEAGGSRGRRKQRKIKRSR